MPPFPYSHSNSLSLFIPYPFSPPPRLRQTISPPRPASPPPSPPETHHHTWPLRTSPTTGTFPTQDLRIGIDAAATAATAASPPPPSQQLFLALLALLPLSFLALGLVGWWWRGYLRLVRRSYYSALPEVEVGEIVLRDVMPFVEIDVASLGKGGRYYGNWFEEFEGDGKN